MAEVRRVRPNGFNVVSTFSGCGGSCLGFEMAGYEILWANEFVPEAAKTYRVNHPDTFLDTRDIRLVTRANMSHVPKGLEIDVLEGSPPCASFSTSGTREAGWGKVKKYSDVEQRVDDLFFEFVRLLKQISPKVFVAENVSGLVKGSAKGYFKEIYRSLAGAGYRVEARMVDASRLGVPQRRRRMIFLGVREDLGVAPAFPSPSREIYSIEDALRTVTPNESIEDPQERGPSLEKYAIGKEWDRLRPGEKGVYLNFIKPIRWEPAPTITQTAGNPGAASIVHPISKRKFSVPELRRLCSFPDDFVLTGTYQQRVERLGRSVPPLMMRAIARTIATEILAKCSR